MNRSLLLIVFAMTLVEGGAQVKLKSKQLESHFNQYEVNFQLLMRARGLDYMEGQVTHEKVRRAVSLFSKGAPGEPVPEFAFLFYHHQTDTLHGWLMDHTGILADTHTPVTVDSLLNLESTLKFSMKIDKLIGTTDRSKKDLKATRKYRLKTPESIELLTDIVFPEPIAKRLAGKKYLLMLPAVNLSSIPFSMLKPWGPSAGVLLDSMSFSFAHNFGQLFETVQDLSALKNQTLIEPVIAGNPSFTDVCTDGLSTLPGAEKEARAVAALFGAQPMIGTAATKTAIVKQMQHSSFIYLATHGWSDSDDPLRKSFIALAGNDSCGYLTPFEIQHLKLTNKPMVVLSACQSGLGKVMEAGIVGVARGFLKAGAYSVTMSLWDVDDAETAELMTEFVKQLQKPHLFFPAEPWRQAVLEYRKKNKKDEPLNWAAFQTFGVPSSMISEVSLHR